jgi:hypothetical protein
MNQDADQLREAFAAHEYLAPDAAEVLAVAQVRARRYRRRRRAAQGAGGAVLGAGLVASSVAAAGWQPFHNGRHGGETVSLAAPPPQPSALRSSRPSPSPSPSASASALASAAPVASPSPLTSAQQDQAISAYFAAGYDYNDALALAQLWHLTADPSTIKAEAGRRLLAGQTLPFKPSAAGVATAAEDADLNAFFAAGYTYEDAVGLAQLWKISDPYQAKIDGGQKLLAGVALPIAPSSQPTPPTVSASPNDSVTIADVDAYFAAGYTYDDAVTLGKLWNDSDTYQVKIDAGTKLLAGQTLPIKP